MAKITKRELSRGIKLTNDDATQTFRAVENQIQAGTVSKENLDADESIFRINLNIPQINSNSMFPQATKRNDFTMFSQEDPLISCVAIPFTLPPPQEFIQMNTDGAEEEDHYATDYTDEDTPYFVLDELSFSFDQRAEGMGIADPHSSVAAAAANWDTPADVGIHVNDRKLVLDGADNYTVKISILEKDQTWFQYPLGTSPSIPYSGPTPGWYRVDEELLRPSNEIVTVEVPAIAFKSKKLRLNPFAVDQLNKNLKPWKTYVIVIQAPELCGGDASRFYVDPTNPATWLYNIPELFCLMSFNLSLKIRCKLMQHDVGTESGAYVQNMPTTHSGGTTPPVIGMTYPGGDDPISASDVQGLQTNTNKIDTIIKDKLDGGYGKESDLQGPRALIDTAGYEVIAVPLWGNFTDWGVMDPSTLALGTFPNQTIVGEALTNGYADRRIIPINYPMTIHHVILAVSFINPKGTSSDQRGNMGLAGTHPFSETLRTSVGVGLGTGHRGAETTYQQVAYCEYGTNAVQPPAIVRPRREITIDRVNLGAAEAMVQGAPQGFWEVELLSCPLVGEGLINGHGTGYKDQGRPIFVGKSVGGLGELPPAPNWNPYGTIVRSPIGDGEGVDVLPWTYGREQWIECRWRFEDPQGLQYQDGAQGPVQNWDTYVGIGGCWVYIIGKKHLTHWKDDLNLP